MTAHPRPASILLRRPLVAGAATVVALGTLRGGIQVAAQQRYSQAGFVLLTLIAATTFWFWVPAFVSWSLRALEGPAVRWTTVAAGAAVVMVGEPVWFLTVLRRAGLWNPPGGFAVTAVLRSDTNLLIFAAIVAAYWLARTSGRRANAAAAAAELRRRAADAELEILTMQLHPHFLFNTLNLVSQLAYESATRARLAIANLRGLLRASMSPSGGGTTTMSRELELLAAYLDIQRERFGSKLDARVTVDASALAARVPRLLLQPLVENAIRHGISQKGSGGALRVRVERTTGDRVRITVADDGVGLTPPVRDGVGLRNVRHRLEQLFPAAARFELGPRTGGGAVAVVDIPFDTEDASANPLTTEPDGVLAIVGRATHSASVGHDAGGIGTKAAITILGWMVIVGIWTEVEAVVPRAMHVAVPWSSILLRNAIIASAWVCLTPALIWLTRRLARERPRSRALWHVVGAAAFTAVHLAVTDALLAAIGTSAAIMHDVRISWPVWDLVAYGFLATAVAMATARRELRLHANDALASQARLSSARLSLMRLQIQPELLLAGLSAVEATVHRPEECERVTASFGDILRSLLQLAGHETATLDDELALLRGYLETIGGDLAAVHTRGSEHDLLVPAVLLQPIAAAIGARSVAVRAERAGDTLVIELSGAQHEAVDAHLLEMVERRIAELYASGGSVRLIRHDTRISARLEFPVTPAVRSTVNRERLASA